MTNWQVWMATVLLAIGGSAVEPAQAMTPDAAADGIVDDAPLFDRATLRCAFEPCGSANPVALAMVEDDAEPADLPEAVPAFGTSGSMRLHVQGGFGLDAAHSNNRLVIGGVGFSYFAADNLSIDMELNGLGAFQRGEDAAGVNFNLLLRYHFLTRDRWTVYMDGGAGILLTSADVPEDGSSFNFTPQAGIGFTMDIGSDNRLFAGVRWHHISNANTFEANPGRDSVYVYAGVSMPF